MVDLAFTGQLVCLFSRLRQTGLRSYKGLALPEALPNWLLRRLGLRSFRQQQVDF